jgi:CspA family cold shock protein
MGRYRDHRQPRNQGFGNDDQQENWEPSYFDRRPAPSTSSSAPAQDAEVVWFNAEKGFGFLKLRDGTDAFLHMSKLEAAGHGSLPTGARLTVRTEPGQKGLQVVEVVSVASEPAAPQPATGRAQPSGMAPDRSEQEAAGVVKRYDPNKGFGFIGLDGGGKDVFVHATTLARCGLVALEPGQQVVITYAQGQKGLEARSVQVR